MFFGHSALLADVVMIVAPLLIAIAEIPRAIRWLREGPQVQFAGTIPPLPRELPRLDTVQLADPVPTERIHLTESFQLELDSPDPLPPPARKPAEATVRVLDARVRPSIRKPRS
jgi:hypothetical protein